jgi:hypothetical protein
MKKSTKQTRPLTSFFKERKLCGGRGLGSCGSRRGIGIRNFSIGKPLGDKQKIRSKG